MYALVHYPAMDLTLSPSEAAFRDELRAWLADNHPGEDPPGEDEAFEHRRTWQLKLFEAGYAGFSWPKEYGGRGATLVEQALFGEEMARAKAPQPANVLGMVMGGPVVITHGTDEQKERWLRPILTGDGDLVPGLLRARVGVRSRVAEDARGQVEYPIGHRRRVGGHRPEGLDDLRAQGQVVHAGRAHRPGRAQAPGPDLLHHGHGAGGRAGAPALPDHQRAGVQRALHRGGSDP